MKCLLPSVGDSLGAAPLLHWGRKPEPEGRAQQHRVMLPALEKNLPKQQFQLRGGTASWGGNGPALPAATCC